MANALVGGFVRLPDARIRYAVYGNGPELIALHGNGEDSHVFDGVMDELCARYRVVALDTRGHGESDRGEKPLDFDTIAADIAAVMEILGIPRAHVLGYSDGGNAALHLALAHPGRVAGMALLGANLNPAGLAARYRAAVSLAYCACSAAARLGPGYRRRRELLGLMANHPNLTPNRIRAVRSPTLVLAGERDMVKRSHTARIAGAIPGARLEIVPGVTHMGLLKSGRVLRIVLDFFGAIPLNG